MGEDGEGEERDEAAEETGKRSRRLLGEGQRSGATLRGNAHLCSRGPIRCRGWPWPVDPVTGNSCAYPRSWRGKAEALPLVASCGEQPPCTDYT